MSSSLKTSHLPRFASTEACSQDSLRSFRTCSTFPMRPIRMYLKDALSFRCPTSQRIYQIWFKRCTTVRECPVCGHIQASHLPPRSFQNESILDFFYVAGILRLSTKYFIAHLRQQAIAHLCRTWAHTLHGHDEMVEIALSTPNVNKLTYPFVHPLHVLNLARETHVKSIIPSVFYFLSLYRLEDLIKADHHKLRYEHPSKPSSDLSPYDLRIYTIMFQKRIEETMLFLRTICGGREAAIECTRKQDCIRSFSNLANRLSRTWAVRTALMYYVVQVQREVDQSAADWCHHCKRAFHDDCDKFRTRLWAEFPGICDLPPWEDLVQEELMESRLRRRS